MADDPEVSSSPPGAVPEQAAADASQARIERIVSRHGGDPSLVQPSPEPDRTTPGGGVPPPGSPGRPAYDIHPKFYERISRGRRIKELEAQNAALNRLIQETVESHDAAPRGPAPPPEEIIPDFDADPRAWYEWRDKKGREELLKEFAPVLEFARSQQQADAGRREQVQRQQQHFAAMNDRREIVQIAEEEYTATEGGQGYYERLGEFGNRLVDYYQQLGHPDQTMGGVQSAAEMAGLHLHGMVTMALQYGFNPAEYVDRAMRAQGVWGQAAAPAPAAPAAKKPAPEQAAMAAAAKSGLASSLSQGGAGRAPASGIAGLKNKETVSVAELKAALAKMPPGSQAQRLRALREAIRKTG